MDISKANGEISLQLKAQILEQIPAPVMAVNKEFEIIYMNKAGEELLSRSSGDIIGKNCSNLFRTPHCNTHNCCMSKALKTGKMEHARNEIALKEGIMPFNYYAVPLKDDNGEIIGGLEFIVDITEQVEYEDRLHEQSRQMSTPTIKLWDGVLVLPVVGVVDSLRGQLIMENMLNKIVAHSAKVIILDIQGVAAIDTAIANHLLKITKATKLMGCECILSGISPAVAQTLIQLGIEMIDTIKTKAILSDALEEAFRLLNKKVIDL